MTATTMPFAPRRSSVGTSQDGPVLLAAKPFGGLGAPLAVARWLAAREDRALRIVTVLEPTDAVTNAAGIPLLPRQFFEDERAMLEEHIRQELCFRGAVRNVPQVDVLQGTSLDPIIDDAREHRARVIVIGSGRHDRIGRYVYGERAIQILSIADRPVLVVPPSGIALSVSVAMIATDFSPASVRAARAVLPMLSKGGRLVVVHVKPGVTLNEDTGGWWNDAYERRCVDRFAQFQRQLPTMPGVTIETTFLRGEPVKTLLDYAQHRGAGIIACGRLGHSVLHRVLVGSVSSALVRHASCPVLVAPELPDDFMRS